MNDVQVTLDYYGQASCSEQWRAFLSEMVSEFYDQVDGDLARNYFFRVGARLAQALPLAPCNSLSEVVDEINRILWQIRWGWVAIEESERHLRVSHGAYPIVPSYENVPEPWLIPVLEGAYTEWLNALGGQPDFRARSTGAPAGEHVPLEFLYGRHAA